MTTKRTGNGKSKRTNNGKSKRASNDKSSHNSKSNCKDSLIHVYGLEAERVEERRYRRSGVLAGCVQNPVGEGCRL